MAESPLHHLLSSGLAFIKIPKVGSQSFSRMLVRSLEDEAQRSQTAVKIFGNKAANSLWPDTHLASRTGQRTVWEEGGRVWPGQVEALQGARFHALLTHWPWGYDPDIYRSVMVTENPVTLAILRDPAERALSSYFYALYRGELGSGRSREALHGSASIEDFDTWLDAYDEFYYSRWFSWPRDQDHPSMERAAENLGSGVTVVGTTDLYAELVLYCHRRFGTRNEVSHDNKTVKNFGVRRWKHFKVADLPDGVRRKLDARTVRDRELYELARKIFRERLAFQEREWA
jgi:hypothetical protein